MRKIIVVIAMFMSFALSMTPAWAGDLQTAYQGYDVAWVNTDTPAVIHVDDRECDGNPVQAKFFVRRPASGEETGPYYVADQDGCGGTSWHKVQCDGCLVTRFRVGEQANDGSWTYSDLTYTSLPT